MNGTAPNPRVQQIRELLVAGLAPLECVVTDESALHVGHVGAAGGGGHFRVRIVAAKFEGQNRLARQRLVYHYLDDMMRADIHALTLITLTPSEA
ncbi:MAG: BolA family protein [Herbaspirillum sp.]